MDEDTARPLSMQSRKPRVITGLSFSKGIRQETSMSSLRSGLEQVAPKETHKRIPSVSQLETPKPVLGASKMLFGIKRGKNPSISIQGVSSPQVRATSGTQVPFKYQED